MTVKYTLRIGSLLNCVKVFEFIFLSTFNDKNSISILAVKKKYFTKKI